MLITVLFLSTLLEKGIVCCVLDKHDGNEMMRPHRQKGEQSTNRLPVGRDCERSESMREIAYKVRVCDRMSEKEIAL